MSNARLLKLRDGSQNVRRSSVESVTLHSTEQADGSDQSGSVSPHTLSISSQQTSIIDEEQPSSIASSSKDETPEQPATWRSLPQKSQLAVLTLARLSEPLAERSLSAYMFYQLRWFDDQASDSTIASQGGIMTASFAAAQFLTAVWWGRAADTPWIGRKRVILIGLLGTCASNIGIGFSQSFRQALVFRTIAGALNGNIGVMRTMVSEIIKEKKYQSRAFLLMPMCFNVGVIIGPIMGGFLSDPVHSFPSTFGPGSFLGGKNGVGWMTAFPYALPNLVSATIVSMAVLGVALGLDETHEALRNKPDVCRRFGMFLARVTSGKKDSYGYSRLSTQDDPLDETAIDLPETPLTATHTSSPPTHRKPESLRHSPLPFRSIFTRNVLLTLLTHFFLAFHVSSFNALIFLLLPTPTSQNKNAHLPFLFTGGLGLSTEQVGLATAVIGVIGLPLQLLLYPQLQARWGTLKSYRMFLPASIAAYILLPFLSLLPSTKLPEWMIWPCLTAILALQVLSRTFALPSTVILVNNSSPGKSNLGTIHGVAQSVSSGARTMGPVVGGWLLGLGLKDGCVGGVWWGMASVAVVNWVLLWSLVEGDEGPGKG